MLEIFDLTEEELLKGEIWGRSREGFDSESPGSMTLDLPISYKWTEGNQADVTHRQRIATGSFGEVHKVCNPFIIQEANFM